MNAPRRDHLLGRISHLLPRVGGHWISTNGRALIHTPDLCLPIFLLQKHNPRNFLVIIVYIPVAPEIDRDFEYLVGNIQHRQFQDTTQTNWPRPRGIGISETQRWTVT